MNAQGFQSVPDGGTDKPASVPPEKTFPVLNMLAAAGIVGPVLFTVGFLAQGVLRTDFRAGYNPIAQSISTLTAGPYGWVQQVNFVVLGVLVIALAVGLSLGMQKTRASVLGPALLAWNGVELVIAACSRCVKRPRVASSVIRSASTARTARSSSGASGSCWWWWPGSWHGMRAGVARPSTPWSQGSCWSCCSC